MPRLFLSSKLDIGTEAHTAHGRVNSTMVLKGLNIHTWINSKVFAKSPVVKKGNHSGKTSFILKKIFTSNFFQFGLQADSTMERKV